MFHSAREKANNALQAWTKYKLKEWAVMALAGIIFVSGYVLGTLNWRKGASRIFVILDIILGTAGFFYFCYKGLQIFAEAHDEILAAIYSTQSNVETGHINQAFDNNYVQPRAVLDSLQVPKVQAEQPSFVDDPGQEDPSYMEFYPYRGSTLALEKQGAEEVGGDQQSSRSAPNLYLKPSHLKLDGAIRARSSNAVHFNHGENVYGNLSSGLCSSDQSLRSLAGSICHLRGLGAASSETSAAGSCKCQRTPALGYRASMHSFRPMQQDAQQCDPMQNYEVPKKLSIDYALTEFPDPNRHLKPQPVRWKPLPMVPLSSKKALAPLEEYVLCRPGLEESPLPSAIKARKEAKETSTGPRPGLEVSPLPYIDGPGDDRSFTGIEKSSGSKQTPARSDEPAGSSREDRGTEARPEQDPERFTDPPKRAHENDPNCLEHDCAADGTPSRNQSLADCCNCENDAPVREDRGDEHESEITRCPSLRQENGSSNAEQDGMLTPEFALNSNNYYRPPQHKNSVYVLDEASMHLIGPEQSPEAENDFGHTVLCEEFTYADQSFHTPPSRPPRVETPLPTFDQPKNRFEYPAISRLAILQHRMSLPMSYHLRATPGSRQSLFHVPSTVRGSLTPVGRYASHPLPMQAHTPSRYLPPSKKSSSSSSNEDGTPKSSGSPAPKKRTTPPSRGSTPSRAKLGRINSLIPRRTGTPL